MPTDANLITLIGYLGGETTAIIKLKEAGTAHWISPNYGTNESGFTALPGGDRNFAAGEFYGIGYKGAFWSSTVAYPHSGWVQELSVNTLYHLAYDWNNGISVRCLCDTAVSEINEINIKTELRIYPNPTKENITIETTNISKEQTISIYNMQGQLIVQQPTQQPKTDIDIIHLAKGVYVIKLSTADGIAVKKFIKE